MYFFFQFVVANLDQGLNSTNRMTLYEEILETKFDHEALLSLVDRILSGTSQDLANGMHKLIKNEKDATKCGSPLQALRRKIIECMIDKLHLKNKEFKAVSRSNIKSI